ncbi:MAG: hypothetical protein HQM06_00445 [Magnetococcales bacterium]|nr:hypothetical protein [Magnetococcales bacterium]
MKPASRQADRARTNERGSALLLTLTLIILATALASALLQMTTRAANISREQIRGMESFYLLESLQEVVRFQLANPASADKCDFAQLPTSGTLTAGAGGELAASVTVFGGESPPYQQLQLQVATPNLATASGQRRLLWHRLRCTVGFAPLYAAGTDFSQPGLGSITIDAGGGGVPMWDGAPTEDCTRAVPAWETPCNAVDRQGVRIFVSPGRDEEKYRFPTFFFPAGAATDPSITAGINTLAPGQYRYVTITSGPATIQLSPGDYYIDALWVQSGVSASLITSGAGTRLHVKYLRNEGALQVNNPTAQPGNVTWYAHADAGVTPPWGGTIYNMEWSGGSFAMDGVIVAEAATTARLSGGTFQLHGGWLSQGSSNILSALTILHDGDAVTAVQNAMTIDDPAIPAPVHFALGRWAEN